MRAVSIEIAFFRIMEVEVISKNEIMKKVKKFAKTSQGRKKIKDKTGISYDPNGLSFKDLKKLGAMARKILHSHIQPVVASVTLDDILISESSKKRDGTIEIKLSFREGALFRESLQPSRYSGVENIVIHFAKGWTARDYVWGSWSGKTNIRSRIAEVPNSFLNDAISSFNAQAKGVAVARLIDDFESLN